MSELRAEDLREGLDALQGDMADHQRATGKLPTGEANRELAAAEFDKLDKQGAFMPPTEMAPAPEPTRQERRRLEREGRKYTMTRDDQHGPALAQPDREREETMKILKRLLFLLKLEDDGILGAPSWKKRVVAVLDKCGGTMGSFMANPSRVSRELDEILDESSKYFGDWRVDPDKRIIVGA